MKGDPEMISYKEALAHVSPNMDQEDPIRAVWVLRTLTGPGANGSQFGSRMSGGVSRSPSNLSLRSLS